MTALIVRQIYWSIDQGPVINERPVCLVVAELYVITVRTVILSGFLPPYRFNVPVKVEYQVCINQKRYHTQKSEPPKPIHNLGYVVNQIGKSLKT